MGQGDTTHAIRRPETIAIVLAWLVLAASYVAATVQAFGISRPYADELIHFAQVDMFRMGDFRVLSDYLTTIPGFHAAVAGAMAMLGLEGIGAARVVCALFGVAAIGAFHALRQAAQPGGGSLATLQFAALPLLAPFFFLVYTDALSLALVLWAAAATFRARHLTSALLLLLSLGVRQNNVVWVGFLACMAVWPIWTREGWAGWRTGVRCAWPYLVPLLAFAGFWFWNGSISMSPTQAAMHPDLSLHAGNVFCLLLVLGVLLPLQAIAGLAEFGRRVVRRPPWLVLPVATFAAFWFGFAADHPANAIMADVFLRNRLLTAITADPSLRAWVGVLIAVSVAAFSTLRLQPRGAWWLVPFSVVFLAGSWLIEQRYVLLPLAFLLAFRVHRDRRIEWATFALWLPAAVWIVHGTLAGRFFL